MELSVAIQAKVEVTPSNWNFGFQPTICGILIRQNKGIKRILILLNAIDNFQFVDAQRTKQYIAASVFVMVVCFVLRVIIRRRMKKG